MKTKRINRVYNYNHILQMQNCPKDNVYEFIKNLALEEIRGKYPQYYWKIYKWGFGKTEKDKHLLYMEFRTTV